MELNALNKQANRNPLFLQMQQITNKQLKKGCIVLDNNFRASKRLSSLAFPVCCRYNELMNRDQRSKLHIIIVVIVVAVLAVAGYFIRERYNKDTAVKKSDAAIIVPFTKVEKHNWHQQVQAIGTVAAKQSITLRAQVAGRITAFYVQPAQQVTAGQKLLQLNPETYIAAVNTAKANLKLSSYTFNRAKKLVADNAVSQAYYDNAMYTMQADQAKLNEAIANYRLTLLRAPFDGKFGLKKVFLGEFLNPGDPIATIQSNHDLRVEFSIPGRYAHLVNVGDTVTCQSDAFPNKTLTGKVYALNAKLQKQTRTLEIWAHLGNVNLIPNTYAYVTLLLGKEYPVHTLPQTAVTKAVDGDFVFKVVNGKAVKTIVQAYERRGDVISIGGLQPGDIVVNGGQNKITDGDRVTDKGSPAMPVNPAVKLHKREKKFDYPGSPEALQQQGIN